MQTLTLTGNQNVEVSELIYKELAERFESEDDNAIEDYVILEVGDIQIRFNYKAYCTSATSDSGDWMTPPSGRIEVAVEIMSVDCTDENEQPIEVKYNQSFLEEDCIYEY